MIVIFEISYHCLITKMNRSLQEKPVSLETILEITMGAASLIFLAVVLIARCVSNYNRGSHGECSFESFRFSKNICSGRRSRRDSSSSGMEGMSQYKPVNIDSDPEVSEHIGVELNNYSSHSGRLHSWEVKV